MALRLKWTASVIIVFAIFNVTDCLLRCFSKNRLSKEIHRCQFLQSFKRGQFERLQEQTKSLESLNNVGMTVTADAICKEIKCNEAYYMLSYLHLTNPQYFRYPDEVDNLHKTMNSLYPEWPRKILATAFNIAQNDAEMDIQWLLYLYVKRIEVHAANDPNNVFLPVMQIAHYGMYKVLLCTMFENHCTMFDRANMLDYNFTAYVADMKRSKPTYDNFSGNLNAVLRLMGKHWPDLLFNSSLSCFQEKNGFSAPGVPPLIEEYFTSNLLYLNDVFENTTMVSTLLTDFGVFENGHLLFRYLQQKITEIKSGRTSFRQYVLTLIDFHEHVLRALNTMMLRIYHEFMDKLTMLQENHREQHVKTFFRPYSDWCIFMHVTKNNGLYQKLLPESRTYDKHFSGITIHNLKERVITVLTINDTVSKVHLDNHSPQSLSRIKIEESQLKIIADEYLIPFNKSLEYPTRLPILCAEVLIGFMKNIFDEINFKAIQSLIKIGSSTNFQRFHEYGQHFNTDVFTQEDEMRSIQVCGTQTILY